MVVYLSTSEAKANLTITDDQGNTSTQSSSASASATAYSTTTCVTISDTLSSSLALSYLEIPNESEYTYRTSVVSNSTIEEVCNCQNYDLSCNEAYYEEQLKTWGKKIQTSSNFLWGAATSAFQIEGSLTADGRGPSIWDTFEDVPGNISNGNKATIAANSYNQYKDDRTLIQNMGCNCYRFSISWTRILPNGKGEINQLGIDHYNDVINDLLENGITPVVTLFHWDTPQALETEYGGMLCTNKEFSYDFANYADVCFAAFGDRVKIWATFNEAQTVCTDGFEYNYHAPGKGNTEGISPNGTEYLAGYNQLLAHGRAVQVFRTKYAYQNSKIGFVCNLDAAIPFSNTQEDIDAAERNFLFWAGWFWDPLFFGDYPEVMKILVGDRLPRFTPEESELLQGSIDLFLWNTYTAKYYKAKKFDPPYIGWIYDQQNELTPYDQCGCPIGPPTQSNWLFITPFEIKVNLVKIQQRYGNGPGTGITMKLKDGSIKSLPLILTEFGMDIIGEVEDTTYEVAKKDCERIYYYKNYFQNIKEGVELTGIDLQGIIPWALIDNFEWNSGFTCRFGINYVDFTTYPEYRPRLPKYTSLWYRNFIEAHPNGP